MKKRFFARLAVFSAAAAAGGSAFAALPEGFSTALAGIKTDGLALFDMVWPVAVAFFTSSLLLKLFKRFANKL